MNITLFLAGAAIAGLTAGGASARVTTHHHHHRARYERYAMPSNPIPYAQLTHYLNASPRERNSIAMAANTGTAMNVSATTTDDTTSVNPPADTNSGMTPGSVNPPK